MVEEILRFDTVTLAFADRHDGEIRGIDFKLRPGCSLLLEVSGEEDCPPFADTASGLLEPAEGRVSMEGRDWTGLSPEEAAGLRGRIGRVFDRNAWISNLDVDENITLGQRHHTKRPEKAIREEALALARCFGRDELPCSRPAWTPPRELIVAQWIRALMGMPVLLLLERPTRGATAEECARLIDAVRQVRNRGGAVVWMTDDARIRDDSSIDATMRANIIGGWEIKI